jgi:hypothetical protein
MLLHDEKDLFYLGTVEENLRWIISPAEIPDQ